MKEEKKESVFETLNAINVNDHTEKKNGLTYLSWAWAWAKVKENYPDSFFTIYENPEGLIYFHDGRTAWVKTGVTIEGQELIEYLPVMDYNNRSLTIERLTSFDVNKAIQRSLTKACARHGLGLYIYAGEDLPEAEAGAQQTKPKAEQAQQAKPKAEPKPQIDDAALTAAIDEAMSASSVDELQKVWDGHAEMHKAAAFVAGVKQAKAILKKGGAA